jgi:Flp pilus assembly pilin Flp
MKGKAVAMTAAPGKTKFGRSLLREEDGQAMIAHALILAPVALVCIGTLFAAKNATFNPVDAGF